MRFHDADGLQERVEEDYEGYDEYEEGFEPEDDDEQEEEQEEAKPTKEEQEFLKLREQLKDKIRRKLKKQHATDFGHSSQPHEKRTVANDKFGSFFGPSQPIIAARVIEESRSIRETKHIVSKVPGSSSSHNKTGPVSSSTELRTHARDHHGKNVEVKNVEFKNKAQTLKDMRDYSFLLSDDADLPEPEEKPTVRKVSVPNSGGRSTQVPLKSKIPVGKPAKLSSNGQQLKNTASTSRHMQSKLGAAKEAPLSRSKQATVESRKVVSVGSVNGPGRPVGPKALPSKVHSQAKPTIKPPAKVVNGPGLNKKPLSAKPHSSTQNHYSEQKRPTHGPEKLKATPRQPFPSAKVQPSKQVLPRTTHEDRPKKRPARRDLEDDDGDDAINMIRQMFRYNPNKYAGVDDQDDSDMEADFDSIMKEERRSAKIAREEDEEQARLIEEEERRERMRKKQRKLGQR